MELVQDWTRRELIANDFSELTFVGALKNEKNPAIFAATTRKILNMADDWFKTTKSAGDSFKVLRNAMSAAGVIVMTSGIVGNNARRALNVNEFRGFVMIDTFAPLIFINANDSDDERLFSLLRGFAHICLGENSLFNGRYSPEKGVEGKDLICNAAAMEILVPQVVFVEMWNAVVKETDAEKAMERLAKVFKCGSTVIADRALGNGFIDYALYEKISSIGNAPKKSAVGRFDACFLKILTNSVTAGRTQYTDAYRLTNTNRFSFKKLTSHAGEIAHG